MPSLSQYGREAEESIRAWLLQIREVWEGRRTARKWVAMYKKSFFWWRKNRPEISLGSLKHVFAVYKDGMLAGEYTADYFEIASNNDAVFWCYPYITAVLSKAEWDIVRYDRMQSER